MGSSGQRARVMGWLGVVAVLSNVLAGFLCMAPAKAVAPVDDILGPLVICTEHGPQTPPEGAPQGGERDQRDGKASHCTACILLVGLALAVAMAFAAVIFPVRVFYPFRAAARTLPDQLALGGVRSRAPPLPA